MQVGLAGSAPRDGSAMAGLSWGRMGARYLLMLGLCLLLLPVAEGALHNLAFRQVEAGGLDPAWAEGSWERSWLLDRPAAAVFMERLPLTLRLLGWGGAVALLPGVAMGQLLRRVRPVWRSMVSVPVLAAVWLPLPIVYLLLVRWALMGGWPFPIRGIWGAVPPLALFLAGLLALAGGGDGAEASGAAGTAVPARRTAAANALALLGWYLPLILFMVGVVERTAGLEGAAGLLFAAGARLDLPLLWFGFRFWLLAGLSARFLLEVLATAVEMRSADVARRRQTAVAASSARNDTPAGGAAVGTTAGSAPVAPVGTTLAGFPGGAVPVETAPRCLGGGSPAPAVWPLIMLGLALLLVGLPLWNGGGAATSAPASPAAGFLTGGRVTASIALQALLAAAMVGVPLGVLLAILGRWGSGTALRLVQSPWLHLLGPGAPYLMGFLFAVLLRPGVDLPVLGMALGAVPGLAATTAVALGLWRAPHRLPIHPGQHAAPSGGWAALLLVAGGMVLMAGHLATAEMLLGQQGLFASPAAPSWGTMLSRPALLVGQPLVVGRMAAAVLGIALLGAGLCRRALGLDIPRE